MCVDYKSIAGVFRGPTLLKPRVTGGHEPLQGHVWGGSGTLRVAPEAHSTPGPRSGAIQGVNAGAMQAEGRLGDPAALAPPAVTNGWSLTLGLPLFVT